MYVYYVCAYVMYVIITMCACYLCMYVTCVRMLINIRLSMSAMYAPYACVLRICVYCVRIYVMYYDFLYMCTLCRYALYVGMSCMGVCCLCMLGPYFKYAPLCI